MCPDEELIQIEVTKANKMIVDAHLDSGSDDAEVNSLPESQQLQSTQTSNNNIEKVDQARSNHRLVCGCDYVLEYVTSSL